MHHGVATPVSNHRGTVATVDGRGRNVVLVWLFDHRGGYALLMIDALTGKSEEFEMPFPPEGDCPYASILSSRNRFYTHFASHFVEFDPSQRAFTFHQQTSPRMAMGMTEDDSGTIWSVTYPQSGVVSFNPLTGDFRDYGHVYEQNWPQYQRHVAADDAGWIYFGIGSTASQIIAFDPLTGKAMPVFPEAERVKGSGYVVRHRNGRVYGHDGNENWYEFHRGESTRIDRPPNIDEEPIIAGSQGLFHAQFPDGKLLQTCDLVERVMVVEDPAAGQVTKHSFDYTSEGAHIMGLAASPDGKICGGTAFPMRFFSYDPETDRWANRESYGQWNTVCRQGNRFFVGGYGGGFLLEWDPSRDWVPTEKGNEVSNPLYLTECTPTIHRPHCLLAHPDGRTIILAGTPGYGYTGGGLLIWDRGRKTGTLLEHTDLLREQSTMSLVALPSGSIIGGTTTAPGTGGEKKAAEAELYLLDITERKLVWHEAVFPGAQEYTDLCPGPGGLVLGFADRKHFFVFDPVEKRVVHEEETESRFGPTITQQGPRVVLSTPDQEIYMLFVKGIARLDPGTFEIKMLAKSPVPIGPGGDILKGRIYFGSGSHLYSWQLPD